jgi:hypothetical protein
MPPTVKPPWRLLVTGNDWSEVNIREMVTRDGASLQKLDLTNCLQTADALLVALAPHCGHLRYLTLWGCVQVTDAGASAFADHCPQLRELVLAGCELVTDACVLRFAASCTRLHTVDLEGCPLVTSAGVGPLCLKNQNLQHLTPGFLRAISQAEEDDPLVENRAQLARR